jgi:hypothetical protein
MTQRYLPAIPFAALCFLSAQSHPQIAAKAKKTRSTGRSWASRLVSSGVRILLASMATLDTAQAVKHHYAQVLITHRQPPQVSQDKLIGVDQSHREQEALTKRIEQDKIRLDRLIDICPTC